MILTAIIGMFATAALAVKTFWYKLKNLFRREDAARERRDEQPGGQAGPASRPD
jgi:hypothetical protein